MSEWTTDENGKAIFVSNSPLGKWFNINGQPIFISKKARLSQVKTESGKIIACQWVTLKNGARVCIGSDGKTYSSKDTKKANWKAYGTEQEALEFTKDSYIKHPVFHGTDIKDVQSIREDGFNTNLGAFGKGVYFSDNMNVAMSYANKSTPAIVKARIRVKNPLITSEVAFQVASEKYGLGKPAFTKYMKEVTKKYDSIIVKGVKDTVGRESNFYVIFDKTNIMTHS